MERPSEQPTTTRRPLPLRLQRFEEAKSLLRKTMPVARRVLGECHDTHDQDEVDLRGGALPGPRRHARRSPRGRDDARGCRAHPRLTHRFSWTFDRIVTFNSPLSCASTRPRDNEPPLIGSHFVIVRGLEPLSHSLQKPRHLSGFFETSTFLDGALR